MRKMTFLLLFFLPTLCFAKTFITPSGLSVEVPDAEVAFIENQDSRAFVLKPFSLPSGLIVWAESLVSVPKAQAAELSLADQIKLFIIIQAQKYGANSDNMLALAKCESNFDINALGDHSKALGLFQWWASSWKKYNKDYGTSLDRTSWEDQATMTAKVLKDGGWGNWWNCENFIRTGTWDISKW